MPLTFYGTECIMKAFSTHAALDSKNSFCRPDANER